MPFQLEPSSLPENSIGDRYLKLCLTLFLFLLLAGPAFGQQDQPSDFESLLTAAQQAQGANNYAAAAADYKRAVELRRDIPELWANLGLMQHETGDYSAAILSFQQANRLKPSLYVPNLFLGIDYVHTGKTKDAIPLLLKAEKMNETDPLPALTLGRAYSSLAEYPQAIHEFQRTIHIDPNQSSAWFAIGITYLHQVEADSRTMTGEDSNSAYAQALFAESLVKQSRFKEATTFYQTALSAADQPPCLQSEIGFAYLTQGETQKAGLAFKTDRDSHPECSLALLGEARLQIDAGSNADALPLLQQAWDADHGFLRSNASLLFEKLSAERTKSFQDFLNQQHSSAKLDENLYTSLTNASNGIAQDATSLNTNTPQPSSNEKLARKSYLSGQYDLCARQLKNALPSGDADALRMLAACAFFTGDYQLSSDAGRALRALPSHPTAAALYWSIKANEKLALASLERFEQLEPDSARSHILLGDIYRQRERYDDAQHEYTRALELTPNDPAALLGLASAYFGDAKIDQALETAQKALALNPEDPETNLLAAEVLIAQHKASDAEPFLLKSLNAKPQMLPHVHALLGEAYAADGKTQQAIEQIKLGLESDQDGGLHYKLARLYAKIGDKADEAIAIEQTKALQKKRRAGAVIAFEDSHPSTLDDAP